MRAKRGAGSFRRTASGRVLYTFSLGVEGGERVRKSVTGRTEKECREKARKVIEAHAAQLPGTSDERLSIFLERWVTGRERFLRPRTIEAYRDTIRNGILPTLKDATLSALSHRDVERMMAAVLARGLSPRSANLARTVLGIALKDAQRDGLVTQNAASLARSVPQRKRLVEPLTPAEVDAFLAYTRESRWWPAYVVSVSLGLRQGELLALTWADVQGAIRIEHTLRHDDGAFYREPPKTASSRRVLPIPEPVRVALEEQRQRQEAERGGRGWIEWPEDYVFRTKQGRPVSGIELTKQFQRDLEAASLPRRRFHDLRHTCATFLLSRGVDLKVISEILGHSNIGTTANTYAHVADALKADALSHFRL